MLVVDLGLVVRPVSLSLIAAINRNQLFLFLLVGNHFRGMWGVWGVGTRPRFSLNWCRQWATIYHHWWFRYWSFWCTGKRPYRDNQHDYLDLVCQWLGIQYRCGWLFGGYMYCSNCIRQNWDHSQVLVIHSSSTLIYVYIYDGMMNVNILKVCGFTLLFLLYQSSLPTFENLHIHSKQF